MTIWRGSLLMWQQSYGWAESWDYDDQTPGNKNPALVIPIYRSLIAPRMQLAGNNTYCNGVRLTGLFNAPPNAAGQGQGIFRDVALIDFVGSGAFGQVGANGQSAPPAVALLVKHNPATFGLPSAYRPYRGLPASMVTNGGQFTPSGAWNNAFLDWKALLQTQKMGWMGLGLQYRGIVANVFQTVLNPGPPAVLGTTATIVLRAPISPVPPPLPLVPLPTGVKLGVQVSGVQGAGQVNGKHIFTFSDQQTLVSYKKLAISPYVAGGQVLFSAKQFTLDGGTAQWTRIDERKPGRPPYLSAGKRRALKVL